MTPPRQSDRECWVLRRGRNEPLVWPFTTKDEANDFALDHGMLDWRAERHDDPSEEHRAVCARCHEAWPCTHVKLDHKARAIIAAAENRCARCGKQCGWMKVTFKGAGDMGQDVRYHGRLGACLNEAKRRAAETQDEGALKDIASCEASREYGRNARALRRYLTVKPGDVDYVDPAR